MDWVLKGPIMQKSLLYIWTQLCSCSVWKQPAYNVKKPATNYFIKPINHERSLQKRGFRFSLCWRHWEEKVLPICDALCPISINTALSEKLRSALLETLLEIMSAPKRLYKCCVLGCANEHRSRHNLSLSEPRTLWLKFIFRKYPGKIR